jgi:hypothetical protein
MHFLDSVGIGFLDLWVVCHRTTYTPRERLWGPEKGLLSQWMLVA